MLSEVSAVKDPFNGEWQEVHATMDDPEWSGAWRSTRIQEIQSRPDDALL